MNEKKGKVPSTNVEKAFARTRFELGVLQSQIAKECGRSASTISGWVTTGKWQRKNGEDPSIEFLSFKDFLQSQKDMELRGEEDINVEVDLVSLTESLTKKVTEDLEAEFNFKSVLRTLDKIEQRFGLNLAFPKEDSIIEVAVTKETSNLTEDENNDLTYRAINQKLQMDIQELKKELELAKVEISRQRKLNRDKTEMIRLLEG